MVVAVEGATVASAWVFAGAAGWDSPGAVAIVAGAIVGSVCGVDVAVSDVWPSLVLAAATESEGSVVRSVSGVTVVVAASSSFPHAPRAIDPNRVTQISRRA